MTLARARRGLPLPRLSAVLVLAALPAAAQTQTWLHQFGTSGHDRGTAAAPDGAGGVFVAGNTDGDFGGMASGGLDLWVARHDGAGNQLWVRQLDNGLLEFDVCAASDGTGGVYVAGQTGAGGHLDDVLLVRYDGAGNLLWKRQLGSSTWDHVADIEPDGSGGVYLIGWTWGHLAGTNAGDDDAWIARYDGGGNQLWIRQLGTDTNDRAEAGAPDGAGGIFVAGATRGSLGGSHAGAYDRWLARYDPSGSLVWIQQSGTSGSEWIVEAAADGAGGLFAIDAHPQTGVWLARYDSGGSQLWSLRFGAGSFSIPFDAISDAAGGLYLCGATGGDLGGPNAGQYDAWFARFDGAGNALALEQLGTPFDDYGMGLAVDGVGGVYVAGTTFGILGASNLGNEDAFLARYDGGTGTCTPLVYCTAKTSSSGCVPSIGSSGSPSIAAGTFAVTGTAIEGGQLGVVFHGTSGQTAQPFQGGFLCVAPPVLRLGVQGSGGLIGTCLGSYSQPAAANVLASAGAGSTVWFQIWFRDPAAATGTGLSDALEVLACP